MKTRKTLEVTFPTSSEATIFVWQMGYNSPRPTWKSDTTFTLPLQRRTERKEMRFFAECCGAKTRTLVG